MRNTLSRSSLHKFLSTIFSSSDGSIRNFTKAFLADGGHLELMEMWWNPREKRMADWAIQKTAYICSQEASHLTDRASEGPHFHDAQFLQVSSKHASVRILNHFRIHDLLDRYERTTPHIQVILKSIINKDKKDLKPGSRDVDSGRTQITSMLLNLRSHWVNYHALINSLLFWDNLVPKRVVQAFNHLGITTSYAFQIRSVAANSRDALELARAAANDPKKIKMLPYDNFNWTARAWESTALHGSVTHDEVSALLVILPTPPNGPNAAQITDIRHFKEAEARQTRHTLSPEQSLSDIFPDKLDQQEFCRNSIIHIQQILCQEIQFFKRFTDSIPGFEDTSALPSQKTEEYYLPTFDQEQGSTRGNMVVLQHYFGNVLQIPKETFEHTMFTVLGDRLTTVRDRAAQDQRAVDRSNHRFDHLSSYSMVSGLMHVVLNFIEALNKCAWGSSTSVDPISLMTLRDLLPNRNTTVNPKKIDYYAWLRFLDVVLQSLVIKAALSALSITTPEDITKKIISYEKLQELAENIVDTYLLSPPSRLETLGKKIVPGNTRCGHAMLLLRDLMTLREMQHSIKHGHPTRIRRMLKFWLPMFYAAGSYNYANECMEILHSVIHDWPADYAQVAFNGMLVNPTGKSDGWKPTDIRVEHLNDRIKERAHGANATPDLLAKITPVMGHVSQLTEQLFEDLNIEYQNQRHAQVSQHKDLQIFVSHLIKEEIFDFISDKLSLHKYANLYQTGCFQLSGSSGGHANHLKRHILRSRTRHGLEFDTDMLTEDSELINAADSNGAQFTLQELEEYYNSAELDTSDEE